MAAPAGASGGEAAEGEGAAPMPKDQREYVEKSSKLTSLGNRIEEAEKQFHHMVAAKSAAKTAAEKQGIIQQMLELTKQRNKDVDSYNKLKADLTYRYPNRGAHLNRNYHTQAKRSMEEMEGAAGLDELLTRTKKVVEKKFAPLAPHEAKPEIKAKAAPPEGEGAKRLRLEK